MPSESQHQAIAILADLWTYSPDVRLGQLLSHLGFLSEVHLGKGLGDVDDDELMAVMLRHHAELTARLQGVAPPPATSTSGVSISGSPIPAKD